MSDDIRLNPPYGTNLHSLVSLSGHSLCIHRTHPIDGLAGTPVPVKFRKDAFSAGCTVVGVNVDEEEEAPKTKAELILEALEAVISRDTKEEIEASGRPTLEAVSKQVGFTVTKPHLEKAFAVFEKSLG